MTVATPPQTTSPKDFASDQEVRWCPGCGDYAILKCVQKTLAGLGVPKEQTVFVSGIGCAARFPYYMSTYGFHTIHGRAPTLATGIKLANPDLDVWVISGDGDALSIGGNHTIHLMRRNVNLQFLLFNNRIYGLTKGQYSPTSQKGTRSPSTPMGSIEHPVSPVQLALGAGARFVARGIDTMQKHLSAVLIRAHEHQGTSFVEVFQNCIVFNDDVFGDFTDKAVAADRQLHLQHGEPMVFGANRDRGIRIRPGTIELEAITVGEGGVTADDLLVHDETNRTLATMLAALEPPDPVALGVLYCDPAPTYGDGVDTQLSQARQSPTTTSLDALLNSGRTWTVAG